MWSSRELALVILIAVTGVAYSTLIYQIAQLVTGIPGLNYVLIVGMAIWISLAFLIFEGRRWRVFLTAMILVLITIPTYVMGPPFELGTRWPAMINAVLIDIIGNSFYRYFKSKDRLIIWGILSTLGFVYLDALLRMIMYPLFLPMEYISSYIWITIILSPVIIIETSVGGYFGYKIYQRVKKILSSVE